MYLVAEQKNRDNTSRLDTATLMARGLDQNHNLIAMSLNWRMFWRSGRLLSALLEMPRILGLSQA